MTTPHIHAKLIKAWADGHAIQYRAVPKQGDWRDAPEHLIWEWSAEYRIKPEPKPDLRLFYWVSDHVVQCSSKIHMHNLALTFDGNTGALKSAEVL